MRVFNDEGSLIAEKEMYGSDGNTTNNKMELQAVIEGLMAIKTRRAEVQVFSDSKYVIDGIRKWIHGWKNRGWKTADGKPVKNADQWWTLDQISSELDVRWTWVKGHADNPGNIIANRLACKGRDAAVAPRDDFEVVE